MNTAFAVVAGLVILFLISIFFRREVSRGGKSLFRSRDFRTFLVILGYPALVITIFANVPRLSYEVGTMGVFRFMAVCGILCIPWGMIYRKVVPRHDIVMFTGIAVIVIVGLTMLRGC